MNSIDPYRITPGDQLDGLIHDWLYGPTSPMLARGRYSADETLARKVERHLRKLSGTKVVTGTTAIRASRWFARYEIDASIATEVFGETYALAVCRLALAWMLEHPSRSLRLAP